jgi:SAM-dependent methyltransferase
MGSAGQLNRRPSGGPEEYDRLVVPFIRPFTQMLVRHAGALDAAEVLDHGAGTGEVTLALHRRWPDAHVTALDPNREMLDRLRAKAGDDAGWLHLQEGTLGQAGFVNQFDLCASQMSLMFVPDPGVDLADLKRAARDNGRLIVVVLAGAETMVPFYSFWSACQQVVDGAVAPADYPHHRFADGAVFRRLATDGGWGDVKVEMVRAERNARPSTLWQWVSTTLPIRMQSGDQTNVAGLPAETRRALREALLTRVERYRHGGVYRLPTAAWLLTADAR